MFVYSKYLSEKINCLSICSKMKKERGKGNKGVKFIDI